jgi:hypothetical protein
MCTIRRAGTRRRSRRNRPIDGDGTTVAPTERATTASAPSTTFV